MNAGVIDLFAGPGGWSEAARMLSIPETGIELDAAACATRAAAGHATVRADVSAFCTERLRDVAGLIGSPPCVVFSAAGKRAGVGVTEILAELTRDSFAGLEDARPAHARTWPGPCAAPGGRRRSSPAPSAPRRSGRRPVRRTGDEPARLIARIRPEWVALEQVPAVLPLWQAYAEELRKLGYSAWCGVLNAADYGVPQTRLRAILIASRVRQVVGPRRRTTTRARASSCSVTAGSAWPRARVGRDRPPRPAVTAGGTSDGRGGAVRPTGRATPGGGARRGQMVAEGRRAAKRRRP